MKVIKVFTDPHQVEILTRDGWTLDTIIATRIAKEMSLATPVLNPNSNGYPQVMSSYRDEIAHDAVPMFVLSKDLDEVELAERLRQQVADLEKAGKLLEADVKTIDADRTKLTRDLERVGKECDDLRAARDASRNTIHKLEGDLAQARKFFGDKAFSDAIVASS